MCEILSSDLTVDDYDIDQNEYYRSFGFFQVNCKIILSLSFDFAISFKNIFRFANKRNNFFEKWIAGPAK